MTSTTTAPTLITAEGLERLRTELAELETTGRADIAAQLKNAAADGDLKENSEYLACREAQSHLETRILRLRERVLTSEVAAEHAEAGVVGFGSAVTFKDKNGGTQTFRIVSSRDANPTQGTLSSESPVARALDGHRTGDVVAVRTPSGVREFVLTEVA
jgi:transcription elongation factor GreA